MSTPRKSCRFIGVVVPFTESEYRALAKDRALKAEPYVRSVIRERLGLREVPYGWRSSQELTTEAEFYRGSDGE